MVSGLGDRVLEDAEAAMGDETLVCVYATEEPSVGRRASSRVLEQ